MAPTLICLDGFEQGINPFTSAVTQGNALYSTVTFPTGGVLCDSTVKRSGGYSLKMVFDGTTAIKLTKTMTLADPRMMVCSFYFYATTNPTSAINLTGIGSG